MSRIKRTFLAASLALATATAAILVNTSPASAAPVYTAIVNRVSGMCLDVPGGTTDNKKAVQQYHCNGGANQQWEYIPGPYAGYGQLRNIASQKCLDVRDESLSPGAVIQQYTCTSGTNQQWTFTSTGNLQVLHSGGCARAVSLAYKTGIEQGVCTWGYVFWDAHL
ncbi:RICIN domain-containing protein [Micromonospora sp. RTGN7]|uniref:RICIN domain-containing protein n=1 Tax=Micromonospora sp. RTGN7 TaxID=3016526 RepID=UPI0029FEE391|nr:RICIN domain-containing protein [Micromonospora sp. RTGN7]